MADRWELFKQWWKTDDEEAPITDASTADDYLVEDSIVKFQGASKEITDITVALSSSRSQVDEILRNLREAVTIAYSYALDGHLDEVKKTLGKVLNT